MHDISSGANPCSIEAITVSSVTLLPTTRTIPVLFLSQFQSLPFDVQAAEVYGSVKAYLDKLGTPIGPNDLMIASISLANKLILVTHNMREFNRVLWLQLEDWETSF